MKTLSLKEIPSDLILLQKSVDGEGEVTLIIGNYDGELEAWSSPSERTDPWNFLYRKKVFSNPIRKLAAFPDNIHILVASSTGNIAIVRDGELVREFEPLLTTDDDAVEISSLCLTDPDSSIHEFSFAVGDDMGNVYALSAKPEESKLSLLLLVQEQDDSITSLTHQKRKKALVASSGDGTIVVIDLKKLKIVAHSTSLDDEITSMIIDYNGDVLCGTGLGAIVKYKWGYWGKVSNRIKPKLHQNSTISAMFAHSNLQPSFITGTAEGAINLVREGEVPENVGQIEDSIETLKVFNLNGHNFAAVTATNDAAVHFLPINPPDSSTIEAEGIQSSAEKIPSKKSKRMPKGKEKVEVQNSFFKDL